MAQNYYSHSRTCATCAYWAGMRTTDALNQCSTVENSSEKGTCKIPQGPWRNCTRTASNSCPSYMKWPVLR